MSAIKKVKWKITKQEKTEVRVTYEVEGTEYNCIVSNVKPDLKEDLLNQMIKNAVSAHYESFHRWVGAAGEFDLDLSLKRTTVVTPPKKNEEPN